MQIGLRHSGVSAAGDVPWGTHFCHFYETSEDLLDILIPYFKAGLENNEFCMWVVFDPLTEDQARQALLRAVPEGDRHLTAGQIEILSYSEWYLADGEFDTRRVMSGWKQKLTAALASGYDGMRISGNIAPLTDGTKKEFARYELAMNEVVAGRAILALCTYPLSVTTGSEVFDLASTHEFGLARRKGNWEVVESPQVRQAKSELKAVSEELERRVAERTLEFEAANQRLRSFSRGLQSAREEESTRIARELHDQLGSALTSLRWDLEGLTRALSDTEHKALLPELELRIAAMIHLTDTTVDAVRGLASELRPSVLDHAGLVEAVEYQAMQFQTRTGIPCHCECTADGIDLSSEQRTAVFRILGEALTNVARHAQATRVDVSMEAAAGGLVLTIRDNGKGITAAQISHRDSLGLLGMQERALAIGGRVEINGAEGNGTTVAVQVPAAPVPA